MARRFRRRRKSRGAWLPSYSFTTGPDVDPTGEIQGFDFEVGIGTDTTPLTQTFPLTWDVPRESVAEAPAEGGGSLADAIGSGYYLRRLIAQCFISIEQSNEVSMAYGAIVAIGFFVARVAGEGNARGEPIGDIGSEYNVLAGGNTREPWIARRVWQLGNQLRGPGALTGAPYHPRTTSDFGDIMSGPYIDQPTKRKVMGDDRLWAAVTIVPVPVDVTNTTDITVGGYVNYRLFGVLAKQRAHGAF